MSSIRGEALSKFLYSIQCWSSGLLPANVRVAWSPDLKGIESQNHWKRDLNTLLPIVLYRLVREGFPGNWMKVQAIFDRGIAIHIQTVCRLAFSEFV